MVLSNIPFFDDNEIFIDIDIDFNQYIYSGYFTSLKKKVKILEEDYGKIYLHIRRSSSGNTHVRLTMSDLFYVLDSFCIRAFLKDDVHRLSLDMYRFITTKDTDKINRCFDCKITHDEVKECGKWIDVWMLSKGEIKDYE